LCTINKEFQNSPLFSEPGYTYKRDFICYNRNANQFDNDKILLYNLGGNMGAMTIIPDLYLEGNSKQWKKPASNLSRY
jgi:hypothetical protein